MSETDATATSAHLRSSNAGEWARARSHPLIVRTADDSISASVFEGWVSSNTHFLRTYRRFLMVMGTLAPDPRGSRLMFQGVQDMDEEIRRAEDFAAQRGINLDAPPSARSMDYSSYCMASVGQGWVRGLVVAFGVEALYYDAWASARASANETGRFWDFIDLWGSSYEADFVAALTVLVDRVELTPELERIFRSTIRLELSSWDEACGLAPAIAE